MTVCSREALATGLVLVTRVAWRAHFGRILPPTDTVIPYAIAQTTHYALYILLGAVALLGIVDALYRGFNLFGVWSLPQFGTGDAATRHSIDEWHELAADLTVLVACLHAAAALVHVWRDHLLERMKP